MTSTSHPLPRLALTTILLGALAGCSILQEFRPAVAVKPMTPGEYIALQRGDILTSGRLSAATEQTLRVAGLDSGACARPATGCIQALADSSGLNRERRLSALSELWLQHALAVPAGPAGTVAGDAVPADPALEAWLEAARHAYAYLFFSPRTPGERAFEDRQTQARDWYNYAVQQATTRLFLQRVGEASGTPAANAADATAPEAGIEDTLRLGEWTLHVDMRNVRFPEGVALPRELLPASSLSFQGLRSTYRRDGFGAELVAVMEDDPVTVLAPAADAQAGTDGIARRQRHAPAWSEMPSPSLTVLFRFAGSDLEQVLASREVVMEVHDPYVDTDVVLHGQRVPLAANFTAGYGLWLARSGFNRQSLRTLFGRANGIDRPHLYMMQPYDPGRRIILMLHGLASSPEAWVNVANEVQGDEALRRNFQVWQVYYPTNMPIALNQAQIRRLVGETLQHFDPQGRARASQDIVLVGHSMGGVISRLLVSSSGRQLWDSFASEREIPARVRPRLESMLTFEPLPQVDRAIFIAAPHRGTAVADHRVGRWIAKLVRLPLTILENFGEVLQALAGSEPGQPDGTPARLPNSIDNLSEKDPFVRAAADLPISPQVRYHSIIARLSAEGPLEQTDDGLVPYRSAHLADALSEKVIVSGHSVQETAPAILEIRRILHQDLDERGAAPVPRQADSRATPEMAPD